MLFGKLCSCSTFLLCRSSIVAHDQKTSWSRQKIFWPLRVCQRVEFKSCQEHSHRSMHRIQCLPDQSQLSQVTAEVAEISRKWCHTTGRKHEIAKDCSRWVFQTCRVDLACTNQQSYDKRICIMCIFIHTVVNCSEDVIAHFCDNRHTEQLTQQYTNINKHNNFWIHGILLQMVPT